MYIYTMGYKQLYTFKYKQYKFKYLFIIYVYHGYTISNGAKFKEEGDKKQ